MSTTTQLLTRAKPLMRLAGEYTLMNVATRLLAAISALLIVRLLSVEDYGIYTLFLTAFMFISTFSDVGSTETLSYFRWRTLKKNQNWTVYYHAIVKFRRRIFILGYSISAFYILFMGTRLGESPTILWALIAFMGIAAWLSLRTSVISFALKLEQKFRLAYAIDLYIDSVKFIIVSVAFSLSLANVFSGVISILSGSLVGAVAAAFYFNKTSLDPVKPNQKKLARANKLLLQQVLPTMPGSVYFSLQGILVGALAAYFGSLTNLAEIGALGRLGIIFTLISGFTSNVFIPRLVSIVDENEFLKRYLIWWIVLTLIGLFLLLATYLYAQIFLLLLGEPYLDLRNELLLVGATAIVNVWGGFAWSISRARGWIKHHIYSVFLTIFFQLAMFLSFDFSSTMSLIAFAFWTATIGFVYQLVTNVAGLFSIFSGRRDSA